MAGSARQIAATRRRMAATDFADQGPCESRCRNAGGVALHCTTPASTGMLAGEDAGAAGG